MLQLVNNHRPVFFRASSVPPFRHLLLYFRFASYVHTSSPIILFYYLYTLLLLPSFSHFFAPVLISALFLLWFALSLLSFLIPSFSASDFAPFLPFLRSFSVFLASPSSSSLSLFYLFCFSSLACSSFLPSSPPPHV